MKRPSRGKDGKFVAATFCYIDDKGYPRICAGPMRGQRLHRIVAAAKLGRTLTPDEDVHHRDGDKLNFDPANLQVLGHQQHGCVSAKQHHYLKGVDISLKHQWDSYFEEVRSGGGADVTFP